METINLVVSLMVGLRLQSQFAVRSKTDEFEDIGAAPADTAAIARRQVHLETPGSIADQAGEFELAVARMANGPAMGIGEAPELLDRSGNRLGDVREMLRKVRREVIET